MPAASDGLLWWQTGVVYQVYPRSFQDSDGDGVGDLAGVIARLDYLAAMLGVDALWLSPFYPSPMADFGYDVADFCDVDPRFGTLATFDKLVDEAHRRGLRVVVDFVPNHTSQKHPWFAESRASRDSPRRGWYVWRDAKPDGSPPNNWLSAFGGPAWTWDDATGQFYLHSFLKEQPDLDWRNPDVKAAMLDVLRFWLDRGVDGFRVDVAHAIMKDPALRDNPPNTAPPPQKKQLGAYDTQLHLHDKGHPDVHAVYREVRALLDGYRPPRVSMGEIHLFDWTAWAAYYGAGDELHFPINFALLNVDWTAAAVRASVDGLEAALPPGAWPNYVLGNHDERRMATALGPAQARVAAVLLLSLRGTPTLYYGDEIGMPEVDVPTERRQDPWGFRSGIPELSRDGCRTPMAWDSSLSAGFSDALPENLWLPLHPDHRRINVEKNLADADSLLNLYRRLLALRRSAPALHAGSYAPLDGVPEGCFAFVRAQGDERALALLNFTPEALRVRVPEAFGGGRVLVATRLAREGESVEGAFALGADEAVLIGRG